MTASVSNADRLYFHALGGALEMLVQQHADWSQATFGSDAERGPIGPLKHLAKEAVEAQEAAAARDADRRVCADRECSTCDRSDANLRTEIADCLLLVLDAGRRAGLSVGDLLEVSLKKLEVNKTRQWPKPTSDEPVEHVR